MGLSTFEEIRPVISPGRILAASTPTAVSVYSTSVFLERLEALIVSTNDTSDVEVQLVFDDTFSDIAVVATKLIPAGAGYTSGVPSVDMMALLPPTVVGVALPAPFNVELNVISTMTTGKQLDYCAIAGRLPTP